MNGPYENAVQVDISVIIPVYNTKSYIARCVSSVLRQQDISFEIILVDDGSIDGSSQLCDVYNKKYECIKMIHKQHEGLGYARNSGLDIACGQYIFFLDSDDWIVEGALAKLKYLACSLQVDVVCFQFQQTFKEAYCITPKECIGRIVNNKELMKAYYNGEIVTSACMALYDKKIFDNIRFANVALHEDAYSKHLFIDKAEWGYITNEIFYIQYVRNNSLIQSPFSEANMISIECGARLVQFAKEKYPNLIGKAFNIKLEREKYLIDHYILGGKNCFRHLNYYHKVLRILSDDITEAIALEDIDRNLCRKIQRMIRHPYLYILRHSIFRIMYGVKAKGIKYMSIAYHKIMGK